MSSHFAKPENALRKAKDLVSAGKESSALRTLHTILTSKRYRTWQATHEKIMQRYIELAIELRRPVKDALIQYRSICHQQNISSLEKMIRKYRRMAEDRAKKAEDDSDSKGDRKEKTSLLEGRDVELDDTPESILQQAITGEDRGDRAGRQVLLPWVKYLWDTYRTILEVIRNNARMEPLYHATVRQAFDFCRHYRRNVEFRHLCDILRQHLTGIAKHQQQTNAVDLQAGETQRLYLETRFEQLRVASELELWQEAYRTIEDIHENMRLSTTTPKPSLMTVYYDKLSRIFWASDNHLFHAYSLSKYFTLAASIKAGSEVKVADEKEVKAGSDSKAKKDEEDVKDEIDRKLPEVTELTPAERKRWATAVVLATLVIPAGERFEHEGLPSAENEGNLRLANLLGFKKETPTRARLLQNVAQTILGDASAEAQKTYDLLETKFGPLTLNAQLAPLLEGFEKDELLAKYVPALKNLTVVRLLKQLSSVYKTMRMDRFIAIAPKLTVGAMERLVMAAVRSDQLQLRWDHRAQLLHFTEEGMESQRVKEQLFALAQRLQKVVDKISPPSATVKAAERKDVYKRVSSGVEAEHKEVFVRRMEIENRKREAERLQDEKEKADQLAKIRETNEKKAEEKKRLEYEQKKRADERAKAEREQHEMEQKKKLADDLARFANKGVSNTKQGKAAAAMLENLQATKKEQLALAQAQLIETEKKEAEKKRRERARQHDYLIRAIRSEEKELLVKAREHQLKADSEAIEEDFKKFEEQHKASHTRALEEKERLARMKKHKEVFFSQIIARRQRELEEEMAAKAKVEKAKAEERAAADARRRAEEEAKQRESDERLRKEQAIAAEKAAAAEAAAKTDDRRPVFRASTGSTGIKAPIDTRGNAAGGPRRGLQAPVARPAGAPAPAAAPVAESPREQVPPPAREPVREPSRFDRERERDAPAASPSQGGNAESGPWRRAGGSADPRDQRPSAASPPQGGGNADAGPWRRGPSAADRDRDSRPAASPTPSQGAPSEGKWRRDGPSAPSSGGAPAAAGGSESGPWRRGGGASSAPPSGGDRPALGSYGGGNNASANADGASDWRGSSAGPFASTGGASRFNREDRDPRSGPPSRFGGGGRGFNRDNADPSRTERSWTRAEPSSAPPASSSAGASDDGFKPANGPRRFGGGARGGR